MSSFGGVFVVGVVVLLLLDVGVVGFECWVLLNLLCAFGMLVFRFNIGVSIGVVVDVVVVVGVGLAFIVCIHLGGILL